MITLTFESKKDNFPNCLSFELSVKSKKISNFLSLFSHKIHEIFLTINFGEEVIEDIPFNVLGMTLSKGKTSFGLSGVILRLKLTNATISLKNLKLISQFQLSFDREIQNEKTRENEGSVTLPKPLSIVTRNKKIDKTYTKIKDSFNAIRNGGTDQNRTWIFQTPNNQFILEGLLQEEIIATLNIVQKPVSIQATFEIQNEDFQLISGSLLLARDIVANRRAWIEREIFLSYIRPQLQPYLSKVELNYE